MKQISEVLDEKMGGLVFGNRVLLPFKAELLKIVIDSEIITNFGKRLKGAHVRVTDYYTEISFLDHKILINEISKYKSIKMVLVQQGKDIFDFNNHVSIEISFLGKHKISIKKIGENLMFFE
jgi:hypothetical protein